MNYFELDPAGAESARENAMLNPIAPGDLGPGFLMRSARDTGKGILQGLIAEPALVLGDYATSRLAPAAQKFDDYFGGTTASDFLKSERRKNLEAVHALMPGPDATWLGQIGYGATTVIPQAIAGGVVGGAVGGVPGAVAGAAALPGTLQGYAATRMGETYEGLDPTTALEKGALEGVFTAAGVLLPAGFGARAATSALVGATGNVTLGAIQRGATGALLDAKGYHDLAQQYHAFDASQMAVDAVLGTAFGVLHARGVKAEEAPPVPPSVVDSALAANKQDHLAVSTAPGVPADPMSRTLHQRTIDKAMEDVMADRPVDVAGTGIEDAAFVPNRAVQEAKVEAAVAEAGTLRSTLSRVDELRAEAERLGLTPADEPLFTGAERPEPPVLGDAVRMDEAQHVRDTLDASGARDLPGAVHGRDGEVFVGDRAEPVRFQVVEADALAATIGKAANQFRDRTRAASQQQISKIASDLQFGRLGEAPTMAEGAPTLAQSGEIIGGNGRVAAVQQAYERGLGDAYRVALEQRAAEFGLTPEQVRGFSRPILVRQFTKPVDIRTAAILSNEGGALRMSALEQARVDAERMPDLAGVDLPESGDLGAASLRDFRNQWLAKYPQTELGEFVGADGRLSPQGEMRLRNAVLYAAYGDSPTLARLIESTDDLSKNLTGALVKAAPGIAEARAMISAGDLHDLDIQPQILEAIDTAHMLRATETKLEDYLAQHDMFGDGIGPESTLLLQHFQKNTRSQRAIAETLTGYYDAVRALGDPKQASMFEASPPARGEILRAVIDKRVPEAPPAELAPAAVAEIPAPTARDAKAELAAATSALPEGISIKETDTGFEAINAAGERVGYLKDNLKRGQAEAIDENANVSSVAVDQKGAGIGRALYAAFYDKHGGRVLPSGQTTAEAWRVWKRNYPEKVEAFAKAEAARIKDGASPQLVLGNITDPAVRRLVAENAEGKTSALPLGAAIRQADRAVAPEMARLAPEQQTKLLGMYESAEREKPIYDASVAKLAKEFGGEAKFGKIKGIDRATAKIKSDYAGDVGRISDLLRATVIVDSFAKVHEVVARIRKDYEIVGKSRNLFEPGAPSMDGYRDAMFKVKAGDITAELQVSTVEFAAAKKVAHDLYEERSAIERKAKDEARDLTPEERVRYDALEAEQRRIYAEADAAESRRASLTAAEKSSAETGMPLRRSESGSNGRGGSESQAATQPTPGQPRETGTPSTSKSSAPLGTDLMSMTASEGSVSHIAENAMSSVSVGQVLHDLPNAQVVTPEGDVVPAGLAIEQADAKIATAQKEAPGIDAAAACALR